MLLYSLTTKFCCVIAWTFSSTSRIIITAGVGVPLQKFIRRQHCNADNFKTIYIYDHNLQNTTRFTCLGWLSSQKMQISALLRRFLKCSSACCLWDFDCLLHEVDSQLFNSMPNGQHCINYLVPNSRNTAYFTRRRNDPYELPYYLVVPVVNTSNNIFSCTYMFYFVYLIRINLSVVCVCVCVCVCVYVLWQVAALSVLSENEVTRLQQS